MVIVPTIHIRQLKYVCIYDKEIKINTQAYCQKCCRRWLYCNINKQLYKKNYTIYIQMKKHSL